MKYRFFSLGDNSLTVEFGSNISVESNQYVIQLKDFLDLNRFPGFIECVPAYSSLTVFYDLTKTRKNFPRCATAFEAVENYIENAVENSQQKLPARHRIIEIPVCFDTEYAPDLDAVASLRELSAQAAIEIFLNRTYQVFMLGFLPGFAYLGELDERIAAPRKSAPRLRVPAGSVALAGKQTGIYPLESPGGWQIIGRTPIKLFTPQNAHPTFLRAGDSVKFYEISKENFLHLANNE